MSNVGCRGTETNITSRSSRFSRNCTAHEGAGVHCDYKPPSSSTIRLVGGKTTKLIGGNITYEGNVLYNNKPIWYETLKIPFYTKTSSSKFTHSTLLVTMVGMIMMQKLCVVCLVMEPLEVMQYMLQNMGNYPTEQLNIILNVKEEKGI